MPIAKKALSLDRSERLWPVVLICLIAGCNVKGVQSNSAEKEQLQKQFSSYTDTIPGSDITFEMVAIPGGAFLMGSLEAEPGRDPDEGPAHAVEIAPFWIGKYEITWDQYELFVYPKTAQEILDKFSSAGIQLDGISQPTPPFVDMSFGMGKNGFPAINMTQYAALSYCKWLSAITGDFYRLPTEAEWEYAARAGTTTRYSFGDDTDLLDDYAWYYDNSDGGYKKIGTKKANAWGLHDMHGNVWEWTLDKYLPEYPVEADQKRTNPWVKADQLYPHALRGGSWDDDPEDLRSASRLPSSANWKQRDPQIPKSNWWMTDASFVGFRIVRPLEKPIQEDIDTYFTDPIPDL